jgi:agmatinase
MKIVKVGGISALGKRGPEGASDKIVVELGVDAEEIVVDNSNVEESGRVVYEMAKGVFESGDKCVFIGGDHSVSSPIVRAFGEKYDDAFLIVFDAHADCMPPMKEATHEEWLRDVVERGFRPENVVLIGARKVEGEEWRFLRDRGIKVFGEIYDLEAVGDYVTENAMGKSVYVSVDVDVLEPSVAPGVSYAEPNGLTSKELFYLLRRVFRVRGVKALDVVEVDVVRDERYDWRTVKVAAKIVDEFLSSERK